MDAFILIATLAVLLAVGVPVAYAVGLSAIVGAFWIDLPLEAVMIQITNGVNKFSLLAIPFFILAGAIMAFPLPHFLSQVSYPAYCWG